MRMPRLDMSPEMAQRCHAAEDSNTESWCSMTHSQHSATRVRPISRIVCTFLTTAADRVWKSVAALDLGSREPCSGFEAESCVAELMWCSAVCMTNSLISGCAGEFASLNMELDDMRVSGYCDGAVEQPSRISRVLLSAVWLGVYWAIGFWCE